MWTQTLDAGFSLCISAFLVTLPGRSCSKVPVTGIRLRLQESQQLPLSHLVSFSLSLSSHRYSLTPGPHEITFQVGDNVMFSDTKVSRANPQTRDSAFIFCIANCTECNPILTRWKGRRSERWCGVLGASWSVWKIVIGWQQC